MAEKYNASNIALEQILNFIKSGEIAIPEIQRPFVWKPKQVRDLIDSFIYWLSHRVSYHLSKSKHQTQRWYTC